MTFYQAKFDSWRFSFEAFGKTEKESIETLKKGLENHAIAYNISPDWWCDYEGDIYAIEVGFGGCYRDNESILGKP
jgi:hypothetical protein|tara:strand:+ start:244 stop:471 length:228 start_codon:yes stop_codon:yes gene_type:complete